MSRRLNREQQILWNLCHVLPRVSIGNGRDVGVTNTGDSRHFRHRVSLEQLSDMHHVSNGEFRLLTSPRVFSWSNWLQVIRVYAAAVAAHVIKWKVARDWPAKILINNPMCWSASARFWIVDPTISIDRHMARPVPTSGPFFNGVPIQPFGSRVSPDEALWLATNPTAVSPSLIGDRSGLSTSTHAEPRRIWLLDAMIFAWHWMTSLAGLKGRRAPGCRKQRWGICVSQLYHYARIHGLFGGLKWHAG